MNLKTETDFDSVYMRYFSQVFSYCLGKCKDRDTAMTVTNDTFILLYQKSDALNFDECPQQLLVWLLRTAKFKLNECKRKDRRRILADDLDVYTDTVAYCEDLMYSEEIYKYENCLVKIKDGLKKPYSDIFDLLIIKEKSQETAASELGMSKGALTMRWKRLKPKIRARIKELKDRGEL